MWSKKSILTPLVLAGLASAGSAQNIHFNEIYASMISTDNNEFIELIGTPNMSLTGIVVVIVDGQDTQHGILKRVWDLDGLTMPGDGYFVLGNVAVPNMDYDLALGPHSGGPANNIENQTETFYILNVPLLQDRVDLTNTFYGTNIDPDGDLITYLGTSTTFSIIENVGMLKTAMDPAHVVHDCGAVLGPDGPNFPAGVWRPGDYPSEWCGDNFLDWANPTGPAQTPGTANPALVCAFDVMTTNGCGGTTTIGTPFCSPATNNSTGMPTDLSAGTITSASGIHLEATQGPPSQFGYFLVGTASNDPGIPISQGNLCLATTGGGIIGRYNVTGTQFNSVGVFDAQGVMLNQVGTSSTPTGFDVPTTVPISGSPTITAGSTWHFQLWHRENGGNSNFSNGLSIDF